MRMLDLFCGEGLAAWGYWRSGAFTEIVGIDCEDMKPAYAFDFIKADALALSYEFLMEFDFIHASPPCQAYSRLTPRPEDHPRLILPTMHMLTAAGRPFVVENVVGSSQELRPQLRLSGLDVGLPMKRPRLFRISGSPGINPRCFAHAKMSRSHVANAKVINVHGGAFVPRADLEAAFGLDTVPPVRRRALTRGGIEQGIPPAMTRLIASALFPQCRIG